MEKLLNRYDIIITIIIIERIIKVSMSKKKNFKSNVQSRLQN